MTDFQTSFDKWKAIADEEFSKPAKPQPSQIASKGFDLSTLLDEAYKGVLSSTDATQASFYGLAGVVGSKFGIDSLRDWGIEGYLRNMEEASQYVAAQDDITKVRDLADVALWAANGLGQLSVNAVTAILGGGVGGIVAKFGVQQSVKQLAKGLVEKGVAREVAEEIASKSMMQAVSRGTIGGLAATSIGQEVGSIGGDIVQETGAMDANAALLGGTAAGLLDVLPQARAAKTILGRGAIKNVASEVIKQAAFEGATEGAQTVIERASVGKAQTGQWLGRETRDRVFSDDGIREIINATALGALGGGVIGGASTIAQRVDTSRSLREINEQIESAQPSRVLSPEQLRQLPVPYRPPLAVDAEGVARPMSPMEVRAAEQERTRRTELGLTPDIEAAQRRKEEGGGLPEDREVRVPEQKEVAPAWKTTREDFLSGERATASPSAWTKIDLDRPVEDVAKEKRRDLVTLATALDLSPFKLKDETGLAQAIKDRRDAIVKANSLTPETKLPAEEAKKLAADLGIKYEGRKGTPFQERAKELSQGFRRAIGTETHATAVEVALRRGETVPKEVLKDYPVLAAEFSPRASEQYKGAIDQMASMIAKDVKDPARLKRLATDIREQAKKLEYTQRVVRQDIASAILATANTTQAARKERRTKLELRKAIESMEPAEAVREIERVRVEKRPGINTMTGLRDMSAHDTLDENKRKPIKAFINLSSIKKINEQFSPADGDRVIQAFAEVLREGEWDAFHVKDDKFLVQFDDEQEAKLGMDLLRKSAEETELEFSDAEGKTYRVESLPFNYGIGTTVEEARSAARAEQERAAEGKPAGQPEDAGVQEGGAEPRRRPGLAAKLSAKTVAGKDFGVGYSRVKGVEVTYDVELEDGQKATRTVDAAVALNSIDKRIDGLKALLDCVRK